jgi:hypothetical protein
MSVKDDLWDHLHIVNGWDVARQAGEAGLPDIHVGYTPAFTGRGYRSARWQVVRPGYKTDPEGHWEDDGHKTFSVLSRDVKESQRLAAIDWASYRYGIEEWGRIAGIPGDWFPVEVVTWIKTRLKKAKKAAKT